MHICMAMETRSALARMGNTAVTITPSDSMYPQRKTCTAIQNVPMQVLFNKLGYARDPEWLQCQKDIYN